MNSLDLRILFLALRDQSIDPVQLAQVGLKWNPTQGPLANFLLDSQLLNPEQFRRLTEALENTPLDQAGQPPSTLADQNQHPEHRNKLEASNTQQDEVATPLDESAPTVQFDGPNPTTPPQPNPPQASPPIPHKIPQGGRYVPETFHRKGGLGQIWQARDALLGRMVALKSIRDDRITAENAVSMFVNEARLTSRLEHPCIVPLYDYVPAVGDNSPWYVMKFVTGETLQEAIQAYHTRRKANEVDTLDLARLLDALIRVCQAVAFAHERGVLHRDLKGQNVILGEFGEVFLLDWGLAKQLKDATPSDPNPTPIDTDRLETKLGEVVGTPGYISPQVAAGHPATKANDIYGLGAILYTILAGRSPAQPNDKPSILPEQTFLPPPEPRVHNPSVPTALQAICLKAMAQEPEQRYATATELATEVRRWLAGETVTAYAEPFLARAGRWANRHRTQVAAAVAILTTALLASLVTVGLVWREERATAAAYELAIKNAERADNNAQRADKERDTAIEFSKELATRISDIAMGRINETSDRQQFEKLQYATTQLARLHQQKPDDSVVTQNLGDMQRFAAGAARMLNETKVATPLYLASIQTWKDLRAIAPENSRLELNHAVTVYDFAGLKTRLGKFAEALQLYQEALDILESALKHGANPNDVKRIRGMCLVEMGTIHQETGQLDAASERFAQGLKLYTELQEFNGDNAPKTVEQFWFAMSTKAHATLLCARKQWPEAMKAHAAAIELLEALAPNLSSERDRSIHLLTIRLDRAETLGKLPRGTTPAAAIMQAIDLDTGIAGLELATQKYDDSRLYRELLCSGYIARGELALDHQQYDAAEIVFKKAEKMMAELRAQSGGISNFRWMLSQCTFGLSRVYDAKKMLAERDLWFGRAKSLVGVGAPVLLYEDTTICRELRAKLMQVEAERAKNKRP